MVIYSDSTKSIKLLLLFLRRSTGYYNFQPSYYLNAITIIKTADCYYYFIINVDAGFDAAFNCFNFDIATI